MLRSSDAAGVNTGLTSSGKLLVAKYLGELGKCGKSWHQLTAIFYVDGCDDNALVVHERGPTQRHTLVEWSKILFYI